MQTGHLTQPQSYSTLIAIMQHQGGHEHKFSIVFAMAYR